MECYDQQHCSFRCYGSTEVSRTGLAACTPYSSFSFPLDNSAASLFLVLQILCFIFTCFICIIDCIFSVDLALLSLLAVLSWSRPVAQWLSPLDLSLYL